MAQQTAVDWLKTRILPMVLSSKRFDAIRLIELAKQMEKEQIIEAYKRESAFMKHVGCTDEMIDKSSIQYYNETYGK